MSGARSRTRPAGRGESASPKRHSGERKVWQVFEYRRPLIPARPRFTT